MMSTDRYYAEQLRCPGEPSLEATREAIRRCVKTAGPKAYAERLRQEMFAKWEWPRGVATDATANVRFQLSERGELQCISVREDSERRLARSVLRAIRDSQPYEPLPPEAICIANTTMQATFENPARRERIVRESDAYYAAKDRCPKAPSKKAARAAIRECMKRESVSAYLARMREEVVDAWTLPKGVTHGHEFVATLALSESGRVQCITVKKGADPTIGRSALLAIRDATPFEPLLADATCLANTRITASFANPLADETEDEPPVAW